MMTERETVTSQEILQRYGTGARNFSGLVIEDPPGCTPFHGASLDDADFSASFIVADFSSASLQGATFAQANLKTCSYEGADLRGADFSGVALCATTFRQARMDGATFKGAYSHSYELGDSEKPDW